MNLVSSTPRLDKYTENELLWAGLTGLSNFGPKKTFLTTSNSSVNSESSFLGWILYSTWQVSPYFTIEVKLALAKLYLKFEIMINIVEIAIECVPKTPAMVRSILSHPSDKITQPFIIFQQKKIWENSLDSISSPSVKFKLWTGKFAWDIKAKHCWELSTSFLFSKVCWQLPAMFCLYTSSKFTRP